MTAPLRQHISHESVTEDQLNQKVESAKKYLGRVLALVDDPSDALIAFSGGKDSIVVAHLAREMGFRQAYCDQSLVFERDKPQYQKSVKELDLDCVFEEPLTMGWLKRNSHYLWADLPTCAKFYGLRQQRSVEKHRVAHGYRVIILGRRYQENTIKAIMYTKASGAVLCNPIADWTTEEIWKYIYRYELSFPEIYDYDVGLINGTGSWVTLSIPYGEQNGIDAIQACWDYEPEILRKVAAWHPPTRRLMKARGLKWD